MFAYFFFLALSCRTRVTVVMLHELFSLPSASGTETVAVPRTDGSYKLHGFKWFTSATDADMTLTLARVQDKTGATIPVLLTSVTKHCQ